MEKSSIVHTRVSPEVKAKCEEIFSKLGITTSYAISLFLNQVALKRGIPFPISLPSDNETEDLTKFAIGISTVDSKEPSLKAKALLELLDKNVIDIETYDSAIERIYINERK